MSKLVGDTFVIAVEPDGVCEFCGKTDELRPYGPNGERVCFECAMKDEAAAKKKFLEVLSGAKNFTVN